MVNLNDIASERIVIEGRNGGDPPLKPRRTTTFKRYVKMEPDDEASAELDDPTLDTEEAAKYIGSSTATVLRMLRTGELCSSKATRGKNGVPKRFHLSELNRWIHAHELPVQAVPLRGDDD